MRLTSIAAGIIALTLAAYPAVSAIGSRASAAPRGRQEESPRGPMGSSPNGRVPADSQQSPEAEPPVQTQQPLQVQTTLVNVFATVRGKRSVIISDLTKEDFKIYEDGAEQKVAYFTKEVEMPVTLGMLMDTSGSMESIFGAEQDAASRFLRQVMGKKDEAMIMSFDQDVNLLADFTQDPDVLDRAIRRAQINAAGPIITPGPTEQRTPIGTNLYDAVYLACHDQLATEAGRKAVIILTDAVDNGSRLSLGDAIQAAQQADAVIHVVLLSEPGFFVSAGLSNNGTSVANEMANDTGGRVIPVRNEKGLEKAFTELSEELRAQYVLGYYPTNPKRDGAFRKIKVEISRPDVKVLARKGYYAPAK